MLSPIEILDEMIAFEKVQLKSFTDIREIRDAKTCIRILITAKEKIEKFGKK